MSEHGATDAVIEAVATMLCGDLDDSADQLPDRPCDGCLAEVRKVVNLLAKAGHGLYQTADVEALAEFYEAAKDYARGQTEQQMGAAIDRRMKANAGITPELVARCRKGERG